MNIKMPTEKITYKFHNLITNTIEIEFLVKKIWSLRFLHKSTNAIGDFSSMGRKRL